MIRRLCGAFLAGAARRWPAELRDEMLAEWRAELHSTPRVWRRLRFAASLAASRPHREPALVVSPRRRLAHAALSLLLLLGLPAPYLLLAVTWTWSYSSDTITHQAWVGVGSIAGAIVLGFICARVTTGVTQLISPMLVPLWTFGLALAGILALIAASGGVPAMADLIDLSLWALSAAVLCTLAARLASAGRPALSWGTAAVAVAVSFWFSIMHSNLSRFEPTGMEPFFDGAFLPAFVFFIGTRGFFHLTLFLVVYAHHLVRRHRAASTHVPAPSPAG